MRPARPPSRPRPSSTCAAFGADGCQLDLSQVASTEPSALDALKKRLGDAGLFLELSVSAKSLEDEQRFADVVAIARRLGALRLRVALLSGRRHENFPTMAAWREFADHWRQALKHLKSALDRHRLPVGLENHKDWRADELVALLRSVDSPYLGACVDFGNNISLLEDPLDTVTKLAPYAVTTHLKDMAVRPYERGFELSEVPLGTGVCSLAKMVEVLRAAKPDVPLCLEMLTRDPLKVPYLDDAYWVSLSGPPLSTGAPAWGNQRRCEPVCCLGCHAARGHAAHRCRAVAEHARRSRFQLKVAGSQSPSERATL